MQSVRYSFEGSGQWPYISITYGRAYQFYDKSVGFCLPLEVYIQLSNYTYKFYVA